MSIVLNTAEILFTGRKTINLSKLYMNGIHLTNNMSYTKLLKPTIKYMYIQANIKIVKTGKHR
jgi:hypothetical protein